MQACQFVLIHLLVSLCEMCARALKATRELGQLVEGLAADHAAAGGFYPSPLLSLLGHAVIGALPIPQLHPAVAQHYAKNAKDTNAESSVAIPPDAPGAFVAAESASPLFLRRTLINRIDSVSEDLSVATVQLMLALLFCGSEQVRLAFLPRSFGNASPSMDCASSDAQTLKSGGSTAEGNTLWMPTLAEFFEAFPGSHAMWPTTQLEAPATGAAMAAAVAAVHQRQAFAAYLHDAQAQVSTFDMAVQSASHGKAMIIEPAASPTDLTRQELEIPEAEEWNFLRTLFRKVLLSFVVEVAIYQGSTLMNLCIEHCGVVCWWLLFALLQMERILTQSVDESIALTVRLRWICAGTLPCCLTTSICLTVLGWFVACRRCFQP